MLHDDAIVKKVWKALSAVLHLSTLEFHETDHEEGPVAAISDRAVSNQGLVNGSEREREGESCTRYSYSFVESSCLNRRKLHSINYTQRLPAANALRMNQVCDALSPECVMPDLLNV